MGEARQKYDTLVESIKKMEKVAIAFSGGTDSTLLLKAALDSKAEVTTFMAIGEIFFPIEQRKALEIAESLGVEVVLLKIDPVNDELFKRNWDDRCYVCKDTIFQKIKKESQKLGIIHILEGSQMDDLKEVRPGRAAILEMNIRSPLVEAKLNKEEVRSLLKELGLPNWNAPSTTCLATRVPHDVRITSEQLRRINKAEDLLSSYHFKDLRVRDHEYWARIEVAPEELTRLFEAHNDIASKLKPLGYRRIAIDLDGYGH